MLFCELLYALIEESKFLSTAFSFLLVHRALLFAGLWPCVAST
jgi:hypothetical protein